MAKQRLAVNQPTLMAGDFLYEEGDGLEEDEVELYQALLPVREGWRGLWRAWSAPHLAPGACRHSARHTCPGARDDVSPIPPRVAAGALAACRWRWMRCPAAAWATARS